MYLTYVAKIFANLLWQLVVCVNSKLTVLFQNRKKPSTIKMKKDNKSQLKNETYGIVQDYSEYSTIQGVIYIFQKQQTACGKIFWSLVVFLMLALGTYWSFKAFNNWQDNPVVTTVKTSAYPVNGIEFPAITICSQGANEDILSAGFFNLFFKFAKKRGVNLGMSPLKGAVLLKKTFLQVKVEVLNHT